MYASEIYYTLMRSLVLASGSPRRKDILEFLGVSFLVEVSDFPEEDVHWKDFEDAGEYVSSIAMGKVLSVAEAHPDAVIIGADTSVFLDGNVYGKPKNLDDARTILQTLRGRRHTVVTGVVVLDSLTREHNQAVVTSSVEFLPFSDEQLENYIETGESLGKAGAYAIQLGAKILVKNVSGSVSNIVGLPIEETAGLLEEFGIRIDVDIEDIVDQHFTFRE